MQRGFRNRQAKSRRRNMVSARTATGTSRERIRAKIKFPTETSLDGNASPSVRDKYEYSLRARFNRSFKNLPADATCWVKVPESAPLKRYLNEKVTRAGNDDIARRIDSLEAPLVVRSRKMWTKLLPMSPASVGLRSARYDVWSPRPRARLKAEAPGRRFADDASKLSPRFSLR